MLLSWEPFDFGWRKASVATARAISHQARAGEAVTRLEVSAAAADAFLTALAPEQTVRAAKAGVERAETFLKTVRTLADNQLRPGLDGSRAEADLAAARNQLIQAQQNADLAKVSLAETIGQAGANLTIDPGPLLAMPQASSSSTINLSTHPLALAQMAALDVVRARQYELDRAYFPRFNWQTALFGRGSGALLNGQFDRGRGFYPDTQMLARLRAPELDAQHSEAEAKVRAAQSQRVEVLARVSSIRAQRLEAEAKLAADEATYQRLKAASATPGVVAGNDVEVAQRSVEAAKARIQLWSENEKAAQAQVKAIEERERALREASLSAKNIEAYLTITAPFDGVITERNVHQGSLATTSGTPMLRLQQVSRLRLVVAVPENEVASVSPGARISFMLPAFPGETFAGTLQRTSHSLDPKTRTMPVELDVMNPAGRLVPGLFPEVIWPVRRPRPSLFVPPSAIATTTERSFVIRIRDGLTEWVEVRRGASMNLQGADLIEVFGDLSAGDVIAVRGTDELRAGTRVSAKPAASQTK